MVVDGEEVRPNMEIKDVVKTLSTDTQH